MRSGLDPAVIFPIYDGPSARLAIVKAECLLSARVIDAAKASRVFARAAAVLYSENYDKAA